MFKEIVSELVWNGIDVTKINYNHKNYYTVYWNGKKVVYPTPIQTGAFIWYTFDPEYGYGVTDEGINQVIDHGSTFDKSSNGNFPGDMHSGSLITLDSNLSLKIPLNFDGDESFGSIIYLNGNTGKFEQIHPLPNQPFYIFNDIVIGSILVLWYNHFTDDDLDILNEKTSSLLDWYYGLNNPFSIIRQQEDKLYPNTENRASIQLAEGNLFSSDNIFDVVSAPDTSSISVTNEGLGKYLIEGNQSNFDNAEFYFLLTRTFNSPLPCKISFDLELISGNLKDCSIEQYHQGSDYGQKVKITSNILFENENNIYFPTKATENKIQIYLNSNNAFSFRLSNIKINPIETYNFIYVEGNAPTSLISNSYYGVQRQQIMTIEGNIGYRSINSRQAYFRGLNEFIDTKVSIDGKNYDFSIMLAFTLPFKDIGKDQYIANGIGLNGNELYIKHISGNPLNVLHVRIGRQMFQVTFDPDLFVHSLIVIWDHNNNTIKFSKDGEDLSSPFPFVFDDQINPIILGALNNSGENSFYGLMGEGILTTNIISNQEWLDFWERVKNQKPYIAPSEVDCDEYYTCYEEWNCAGEYELDCSEVIECGDFLI